MKNVFENFKNKLYSHFIKKEEKKLIKIGRKDLISRTCFASVVAIIPIAILNMIILSYYDSLLVYLLNFFWSAPLFLIICKFIKKNCFYYTLSNVMNEENIKEIKKIINIEYDRDWEKCGLKELIELFDETKVDPDLLEIFNSEIGKKISEEEINKILNDEIFINMFKKHDGVTYGYLLTLLEKVEEVDKTRKTLDLQKEIFAHNKNKLVLNSEIQDKESVFDYCK